VTLRQKQSLFARLLCEHVLWLYEQGYEITFGDVLRSPEEAERLGLKESLHTLKLAADLNLFRNGRYLRSTESHRLSGEKWETRHVLCRWGGRFESPDGNHYSVAHAGRA
jgi:hypothetical protein